MTEDVKVKLHEPDNFCFYGYVSDRPYKYGKLRLVTYHSDANTLLYIHYPDLGTFLIESNDKNLIQMYYDMLYISKRGANVKNKLYLVLSDVYYRATVGFQIDNNFKIIDELKSLFNNYVEYDDRGRACLTKHPDHIIKHLQKYASSLINDDEN